MKKKAQPSRFFSPRTQAEQRIEICNRCPELNSLKQCKKCGCFIAAKTRLKKQQCPIGKW